MADRDAARGMTPPAGTARCEGVSWTDLLQRDRGPVPDHFLAESAPVLPTTPLAADRYTSAAFLEAEKRMWRQVWQFAAREEELPEPGDYVVYENLGKSYLIVRQADGSVKALVNVCLHRGRKLRTESGHANDFQCPFHAFTWETDGALKHIPCRWDFAHLTDAAMRLPEVRIGQWAGFIFLCEDPHAPDLLTYLDPLPQHFARWRLEDCTTALWVGKVVKANWKATMEAFMEAWHSIVTHPQILEFLGDANTRYDLYGRHVNRAITPMGVVSPHLYGQGRSEQSIVDAFFRDSGRAAATGIPSVGDHSARETMADLHRDAYLSSLGYDAAGTCDSDFLEAWVYNVFPNFAPWGGFIPNIVYRWRPWPDADHCLMEVRILMRTPKGQPVARAAPMRLLGPDEPWTACAELGSLGGVFEQDMANLPFVQDGLKASANNRVELGAYQESRIRHFHETLDWYLAQP